MPPPRRRGTRSRKEGGQQGVAERQTHCGGGSRFDNREGAGKIVASEDPFSSPAGGCYWLDLDSSLDAAGHCYAYHTKQIIYPMPVVYFQILCDTVVCTWVLTDCLCGDARICVFLWQHNSWGLIYYGSASTIKDILIKGVFFA